MVAVPEIWRAVLALSPLMQETPTVAPTPAVEPTPTVVAAAPPTAPPLASLWNPGQWFTKTGWRTDFHAIFLALFVLMAIGAIVAYYYYKERRFKSHTLNARLAERVSYVLTAFAAVGLLFMVFVVAMAPLLSFPIWEILALVAFIAFVIYAGYYYKTLYPPQLEKYQREQVRARYLPKPRTKGPAVTPPLRKKGKDGREREKEARPAAKAPATRSGKKK